MPAPPRTTAESRSRLISQGTPRGRQSATSGLVQRLSQALPHAKAGGGSWGRSRPLRGPLRSDEVLGPLRPARDDGLVVQRAAAHVVAVHVSLALEDLEGAVLHQLADKAGEAALVRVGEEAVLDAEGQPARGAHVAHGL